jgi:hypothetical protein
LDSEQQLRLTQAAHIAQGDFDRARRRAFLNDLASTFGGKPNWLLSFEEVQRALPIHGQVYRGVQQVPLAEIVGSVDRYHDFDRQFLPTQSFTRPRWESVDIANLTDVSLPPVQLYRVGDVYFVKDGNHRVSVAKEKGMDYIDAEVIELPSSVPLPPISSIKDQQDLIRLAEYARFLAQTKLDKLRPNVKIAFTSLGRYDVLLEHISAHRWYMGIEQNRPIEWEEAVLDWYDNIYLPLVKIIEEKGILNDFPGRTAGDLYLWIMDHRWYLHEDTGIDIGPHTAALSYDAQYARWTRKVVRFLHRMQDAAARPLVVSARRIARALKASE